ncbi:MAG: DUF2341 domain-containing protein [Akkermansiaceae bacterium]|nr:DUF2341 domain-containing protein [Akkermansiaceae bacterium]
MKHMIKQLMIGKAALLVLLGTASAQYPGWQHTGSIAILTTPEGANLPASAVIKDFPVLVRLHQDWFDFSQAMPGGEDLRFSTDGKALAYQVEEWDAAHGVASIWVRIPLIKGNAIQPLKLHWGKAGAASESNGAAVFNASNGYASVWHLGEAVKDEVGTLESEDKGTTTTPGMIGKARHFPGKMGVFCGDKIPNYPSGDGSHSTEAWFRAEVSNSTIIGWGNEGGNRGSKVRMQFRSPPHIHIDSDFSDVAGKSTLPMGEWIHVAHTYSSKDGKLYINGKLDGESNPLLNIKSPGRLWIGGWYNNYDFVGDIDEARISRVARSADWIRMEYENQKPLQTLVGPVVQPGNEFSVSKTRLTIAEGKTVTLTATAGGALKVYWTLTRGGREVVVAIDRFRFEFDAGRVTGDETATLQCKAIYQSGVKTADIAITVKEGIAEPVFTLKAPATWDGRTTIKVEPEIANLDAMLESGAGDFKWDCGVTGLAVIKQLEPGSLILYRAQNSGVMTVTATISNGGTPTTASARILVTEPKNDAWVQRTPAQDEKPEDNQFYARDDHNEGTLYCNGTLARAADTLFLKLYADDKLIQTLDQQPTAENTYAFTAKLKPGLIKYKVELGAKTGGAETILHQAGNLVCGDAYLIDGQSNALATDTGEKSPTVTNEWIRSYAQPRFYRAGETQNLWSNPVWKAQPEHTSELGWWGMELAKNLLQSQQVPIFIINGAVGGTRIDQHQRNPETPEDLETIYGRLLWRVRQAKLTHGIRAVLWHQGENDQGSAGPDGGYGWETYQKYFIDMSAAWKQDFPNLRHYYLYQIWPNSCSMGGGNGNMLREKQRTLSSLYSNMDVMSTLGIDPPGPCHFPLVGWSEFARLIQPLIERDFYGGKTDVSITAPNLRQVYYPGNKRDEIVLEFDQPVIWFADLVSEFQLDGEKGKVVSGRVNGNLVTLKLKDGAAAKSISYLDERSWSQKNLLLGTNGIAALTFCEVPILPGPPKH